MPRFNLNKSSPVGSFLGGFAKGFGGARDSDLRRAELQERKEQNDKMNEFRQKTQERQKRLNNVRNRRLRMMNGGITIMLG